MNMIERRTLRSSVNTVRSNSTRKRLRDMNQAAPSDRSPASSVSKLSNSKTKRNTRAIAGPRPRNVLIATRMFA